MATDNRESNPLASTALPSEQSSQPTLRGKQDFIGETLKGRYLIETELGRGGFGVVYLARDKQLHSRPVVVKVLIEKGYRDKWVVKKFRQEIEALTRINHPGVAGIFDAGELEDGKPFIVMEYVDGVTLRAVLKPEGMDLQRAAQIIRQIGRALAAAHDKQIYHCDLKPENVMLRNLDEADEQVKIIDFGIAKVKNSVVAPSTDTNTTAGTVAYMAPEQLGGRTVSAATDIYSLGAIAYEMVTGRRPFNPETVFALLEMQRAGVRVKPQDLRPSLPEDAERIILKALSFEPMDRYARARDLGDDVALALTNTETIRRAPPKTPALHTVPAVSEPASSDFATVAAVKQPPPIRTIPAPYTPARPPSAEKLARRASHTGSTSAPTSADLATPQNAALLPASYPSQTVSQPLAQPAPPPKKMSATSLILGGLLLLLLLGGGSAAVGYLFVLKPWMEAPDERPVITNTRPTTNENSNANTNAPTTNFTTNTNANNETKKESDVFVPPAKAVKFVNSKDNLDGKLAEHYLDFSFYYLNSWTKDPKAGVPGATSFVKVERRLPPYFTQENVAVGWYDSKGTFALDKDDFPKLVQSLSSNYATRFPEYQKLSEGPTKVNSLDAYEFRFEGLSKGTAQGDIKLWGRVIFLPSGVEGNKSGVTLLIFTTSLAPELQGPDDVGVKGELPLILDSFRFGANK